MSSSAGALLETVYDIVSRCRERTAPGVFPDPAAILADLASWDCPALEALLESPTRLTAGLRKLGHQKVRTHLLANDPFWCAQPPPPPPATPPSDTMLLAASASAQTPLPERRTLDQLERQEHASILWQDMDELAVPWSSSDGGSSGGADPSAAQGLASPATPPAVSTRAMATALQAAVRSEFKRRIKRSRSSPGKGAALVKRHADALLEGCEQLANAWGGMPTLEGQVALECFQDLLAESQARAAAELAALEMSADTYRQRLVQLDQHAKQLESLASQEASDIQLDREASEAKAKRQREDLLVPLSRRGSARLRSQGRGTETLGFGRGSRKKTNKKVTTLGKGPAAEASPAVAAKQRQDARRARLRIVHACISALVQDSVATGQSRSAAHGSAGSGTSPRNGPREASQNRETEDRVAGVVEETGAYDSETYGEMIAALQQDLVLARAERQEAILQLKHERSEIKAAHEFALEELRARLVAEQHKSILLAKCLQGPVRAALRRSRADLDRLAIVMGQHRMQFEAELDWVRFDLEKRMANEAVERAAACDAARATTRAQEQATRRAFTAAFEARILELEQAVAEKTEREGTLQVQLRQTQKKVEAAEHLLVRLRSRSLQMQQGRTD